MKNLLNFFFSFDKLFKEKLIVPFFWLALIVVGLAFLEEAFRAIKLPPLGAFAGFINFFALLLLSLLAIRIVSELAVALFRINDNLSPDGGKSELADIDPIAEARKAAELAATRTREATRSVSEKASEATKTMRENVGEMSGNVQDKAKAATASVRGKAEGLKSKTGTENVVEEAEVILEAPKTQSRQKVTSSKSKTTTAKPAAAKTTPKKRGRPAGSKSKTTSAKTGAKKTTTKSTGKSTGKRGPKPGTKIPRDADGNLLKKDGTPRKKPGPRK
jgi:hypothetical protein